eukprot:CAMPEP_0184351234 /NCGR_PEP_ID=MMETSP1089-20130417/43496_1 /TAXON_ID=38269 ORGANISM="Gloeochaete wittrockiana, Strain SAG46.84" /NCGR_SAMPLE_ID=MMETSP1089 /ASSEMBLY_ACC=CAM_ASM_000445 /LENGTH=188 /DNA_ID=CAMNT_0026684533 /DNA_START=63 /DNA_END=629 /DNA_ORIENTATION=+
MDKMKILPGKSAKSLKACYTSSWLVKLATLGSMVGAIVTLILAGHVIQKGYGGEWTPHVLIATGVFNLLVSCTGFWAAVTKNRAVLCCFACLLLPITLVEFAVSIACFTARDRLLDYYAALYKDHREKFEAIFPGATPEMLEANARSAFDSLGGFGLALVFAEFAVIAAALLYRRKLRDDEYERWRYI